MDYNILFKRPFEFLNGRLGNVDATFLYLDIDFKNSMSVHKPHELTLISNKQLPDYEKSGDVYKKVCYISQLTDKAANIYSIIKRGPIYNNNPLTTNIEKILFGINEKYVFIPSHKSAKSIGIEHEYTLFPEDSIIAHELTHAWNDDFGLEKLANHIGNSDKDASDEALAKLIDLSYILEYYPDYFDPRLEKIAENAVQYAVLKKSNCEWLDGAASEIVLDYWKTSGKSENLFRELKSISAPSAFS